MCLVPRIVAEIFPSVQPEDELEFTFHQRLDSAANRIPDVILESDEATILVEAKRGATFSQNQLKEEYSDLKEYGSGEKNVVLVSGHTSRPEQLSQVEIPSEDLHWVGWRTIALTIHEKLSNDELSHSGQKTAKLVVEILDDEGYVPFTGFSSTLDDGKNFEEELENHWKVVNSFYKQINTFRRDLDGHLAEEGLKARDLYRDGLSNTLNRFPKDWAFVTDHLWLIYGDSDTNISGKSGAYPFVCFNTQRGAIRVGYTLSAKDNSTHRKAVKENQDQIIDFVDDNDALVIKSSWNFRKIDEVVGTEQIKSSLESDSWIEDGKRVQVVFEHDAKEMRDQNLTETVATELSNLHELGKQLGWNEL